MTFAMTPAEWVELWLRYEDGNEKARFEYDRRLSRQMECQRHATAFLRVHYDKVCRNRLERAA